MKTTKFLVTFSHTLINVYGMSFREAIIKATAEMMNKALDSTIIKIENTETGKVMVNPIIVIQL